MAVDLGILAGSTAMVIAGSTAAATTSGYCALLAAASAVISGAGIATVSCGLIWRRIAARTRAAALALGVIAALTYAVGASVVALHARQQPRGDSTQSFHDARKARPIAISLAGPREAGRGRGAA